MLPSPIKPAPALNDSQLRWRNQLEGERAQRARQGGVVGSPPVVQGNIGGALGSLAASRGALQAEQAPSEASAPRGPQISASDIVKGALKGGVAGIAKEIGGKALQGLNMQDAEQMAAKLFKENVVIKIGVPLVLSGDLFLTGPALIIYWILSMFGIRGTAPSELHEHVFMIALVVVEAVLFIGILVIFAIMACFFSPSCQYDIFQNAVIPNVI